jgi:4'-phosphopantetheinyl transferase EntD
MRLNTLAKPDNPACFSPLLTSVFPPGVTGAELRITGDPSLLFPDEAQYLERAVPKRIQEFAAGRLCARRALAKLGFAHFPLQVNRDRRPHWPETVVGCITHADHICGAVVAERRQFRSIGLDVEIVGHVTQEIWPYICTKEEIDWLSALPEPQQSRCAALLFSVKETFYKCQFGVTRQWLEFCDVALETVSGVPNAGCFALKPQKQIDLLKQHSAPLSGRFQFHGNLVVTGMILEPIS